LAEAAFFSAIFGDDRIITPRTWGLRRLFSRRQRQAREERRNSGAYDALQAARKLDLKTMNRLHDRIQHPDQRRRPSG